MGSQGGQSKAGKRHEEEKRATHSEDPGRGKLNSVKLYHVEVDSSLNIQCHLNATTVSCLLVVDSFSKGSHHSP